MTGENKEKSPELKDAIFHIKPDKSDKVKGKTRGERKRFRRMKRFLDIFHNQTCKIYLTCDKSNVHPSTYYEWLAKYPWFAEAIDKEENRLKDIGENALLKKIKEGNTRAIVFYNETKNKDRGYTKKMITEHQGEIKQTFAPIKINIIRPNEKGEQKGESKTKEEKKTSDRSETPS